MQYWPEGTIDKIRKGYYSAVYFDRTRTILLKENNRRKVTMQIFQRQDGSVLCGIGEVLKLLKEGAGFYQEGRWVNMFSELEIHNLRDGDPISRGESVMHITGPYVYFAHLESLYLGILARSTLIATNTRKAVSAAQHKPVIFFADRFDHFLNQEGDGYAAHIGGVSGVCTRAQNAWFDGDPNGTIPHALIAVNDGDAVTAGRQFAKHFPDKRLIVLVDFQNDCVGTALTVAHGLGSLLWGVRLDTSGDMVDIAFKNPKSIDTVYGVNPQLVKNVREALDTAGFRNVKIVVSGGFTADKITRFEQEHVPVDAYGVGSALLKGNNDFTADIVRVEGKPMAKAGREYRPNERFHVMS
jgi:nicotinate phosphoribosyltransferase